MSENKLLVKRLMRDYQKYQAEPVEFCSVYVSEDDLQKWYFLLEFPNDKEYKPYNGGQFMGNLIFPKEYPWKAPDVTMMTPTGRYEINRPLCLSNTGFHNDTWSSSWTPTTILRGFISTFFSKDSADTHGLGHLMASDKEREKYTKDSRTFNEKVLIDYLKLFQKEK